MFILIIIPIKFPVGYFIEMELKILLIKKEEK